LAVFGRGFAGRICSKSQSSHVCRQARQLAASRMASTACRDSSKDSVAVNACSCHLRGVCEGKSLKLRACECCLDNLRKYELQRLEGSGVCLELDTMQSKLDKTEQRIGVTCHRDLK
jgi:hypothetical protein